MWFPFIDNPVEFLPLIIPQKNPLETQAATQTLAATASL